MNMTSWFILPYDGTVVARATLVRSAASIRERRGHAGVLLAVAGVEPEALGDLLREARGLAGPEIALDARLLHPGDPLGSLRALLACVPASLAAPVDPRGATPWCMAAWQLEEAGRTRVLFFLNSGELRAATRRGHPDECGERAAAGPLGLRWEYVFWAVLMLTGLGAATLGALAVNNAVQSPAAATWVYLLVVLPVALRWGRTLSVATAALAAMLLLVVLVEPRFSVAVEDPRDASSVAISLGCMVGAALLVQGRWRHMDHSAPHRRRMDDQE